MFVIVHDDFVPDLKRKYIILSTQTACSLNSTQISPLFITTLQQDYKDTSHYIPVVCFTSSSKRTSEKNLTSVLLLSF